MAEILKLAHFVQHDSVAQMQIWRGRVEAKLDPELAAGCEFLAQIRFDNQFVSPALDNGQCGVNIGSNIHIVNFKVVNA